MKQGAPQVFQRDHSFYMNSHGGSAGRYHFAGKDGASACGRARILDDANPHDPSKIPVILRCRARGCAEKWMQLSGKTKASLL
jgi:hypothetical protein